MQAFLSWTHENAALILLVWPIVTGVVSLVYNYLDHMPRVHAVLSAFVSAGLDVPSLMDALKRLLTGQPPGGGKPRVVVVNPPCPLPPPTPPPAATRAALMLAMLGLGACAWWGSHGAQTERDVAEVAACVLEHAESPPADIASACGGIAIDDVLKILAAHRAAAAREHEGCTK